jgi:hypothetical protein
MVVAAATMYRRLIYTYGLIPSEVFLASQTRRALNPHTAGHDRWPQLPLSRASRPSAKLAGLLVELMPETVHFEVSSFLLIALLVALWIWRQPPQGGGP